MTVIRSNNSRRFLILAGFLLFATGFTSSAFAQSPPNIGVNARLATDPVRRGRSVQATVTMDIPSGFHVNSNRPLEKFLIPTQLRMEAPNGVRLGAVVYPRALQRSLKFSKNKVAVYEGKATMRFNVTVPANFSGNSAELKGHLRYQSCNDDVCFPPKMVDFSLWVKIE